MPWYRILIFLAGHDLTTWHSGSSQPGRHQLQDLAWHSGVQPVSKIQGLNVESLLFMVLHRSERGAAGTQWSLLAHRGTRRCSSVLKLHTLPAALPIVA